ncbi:DNA polymerase III subunit delta [Candidatus Pelagibacter sp.]|nr:DNA polymerase III subunit delta [Candidatus Pelagibacter sp.]
MIIKTYKIKSALQENRFYLFYGENTGLKEEVILELRNKSPDSEYLNYFEKDILQDTNLFYEDIFSKSFFNDKKLIIIKDSSDKFLEIAKSILEKGLQDLTIVLVADNLDKRSKLRGYFEKEKNLYCVPFYKDENSTLNTLAINFFSKVKINISQELINIIVSKCSRDRKNLLNDLNKIKLFLQDKKKIDKFTLSKIINLADDHSLNEIVDNTLLKNKNQVSKMLNENDFVFEDMIILIRSFLKNIKRLVNLKAQLGAKNNINEIIQNYKPPIFWKDKEIVKRQSELWEKNELILLIKKTNNTELMLKKNSQIYKQIIGNFINNFFERFNN